MKLDPSLLSFIGRSQRRIEVLLKLKERLMSQPELKKITGMYKAHISRTLKELSEKNLITCINLDDRRFKFYKITPLGNKVILEIKRILG